MGGYSGHMTILGDTTPEARLAQLDAFRRMDGATRVAIACEMSDETRALSEAGERHRLRMSQQPRRTGSAVLSG